MTYAEWIARWPFWNNRIVAMSESIVEKLPRRIQNRCSVIGDLTADLTETAKIDDPLPLENGLLSCQVQKAPN